MPLVTNLVLKVITAFCICKTCCGPNATGITASGKPPVPGRTIAASRSLPFGTKIIISGKTYMVEDRLAPRFDSRIDIYFSNHSDARKFGIRTNVVKIVTTTKKKGT